jgi:transcriptional regulator with XRE-family HTH domain
MIEAVSAPSRRQDLAAFLRLRRDGLSPQDAGIVVEERRHVPGLRREEVAELAGISTTWYTWLEQGREINVSPEVLQRIGAAMRLGAHEVAYLQRLASDATPLTYTADPEVPDVLRALVEKHEDAPAYIATPRFDLVVWNRFLGELMNYDAKSERLARNIIYRIFFDRSRRKLFADWEDAARRGVAVLRSNFSYYAGDKHFEDLLRRLMQSPEFERMWNAHEVAAPGMPPFIIRHDTMGVLQLSTVQASLDTAHGAILAIYDCKRLS